jgi:hypothetical protein
MLLALVLASQIGYRSAQEGIEWSLALTLPVLLAIEKGIIDFETNSG